MRATHAINNIYKLISFLNLYLLFLYKLLSDQDFMKVFISNCSSVMHGYQDNEVLLPTGYDVIVSPPSGSASRTIHDGF